MTNVNGSGNHQNDNDGEPENIVRIPTLAERDRLRREKDKLDRKIASDAAGPIINMPPFTLALLITIVGIHILMSQILSPEQAETIILNFSFIPEHFSNGDIGGLTLLTPLTHMFLHGSWMHVAMNALMLAAFGSGIERWIGSKRMAILFIGSGLLGAAAHYFLNASSPHTMIGASGGISGLFAGAILMLSRGQREMGGRWGILPFVLLWIGLSIGFGMMGAPDGSAIAWASHVGGFLGGFAILKLMRV